MNNPVTEEFNDESEETEMDDEDGNDLEDVDQSFFQRMKSVMSNPYYLLLCLSLTFLYYIITGI